MNMQIKSCCEHKIVSLAGEALLQVYTQQHTSALLSTVILAIIQNGKACHPNFPYCPALIDHCATPF